MMESTRGILYPKTLSPFSVLDIPRWFESPLPVAAKTKMQRLRATEVVTDSGLPLRNLASKTPRRLQKFDPLDLQQA